MTCFYLHYLFILLLLLFGHAGCRILAPQTGIEAVPPVVEEKNLFFFKFIYLFSLEANYNIVVCGGFCHTLT